MSELVSIITPSYNSEKYIVETIQSVIHQTYKNWELIIVDDCSVDNTRSIIKKFTEKDSRIHLFQLSHNSGAGTARQTALDNANGKYITFLDADDIWKPQKIEKQITFMKEKNIPFTFSFYEWIDEDSNSLNKLIQAPTPLRYRQLFFCNYIGNLTGIYDADFFGKISITSLRKRQDWIVWLTILKKIEKAYPVCESLAYYRIRQESLSKSKIKLLKFNYLVYKNFHRYSTIVSLFCMVGFLFTQLIIKPKYMNKNL